MMLRIVGGLAALLGFGLAFEEGGAVHVLTDETHDDFLEGPHSKEGSLMVMYWATWNEKSKDAVPEFSAAASELAGSKQYAFAAVDCAGAGKKTCASKKVRSFPTYHLYDKGELAETFKDALYSDEVVETMQAERKKATQAAMPELIDIEGNVYHALYTSQLASKSMGKLKTIDHTNIEEVKAQKGKVAIVYQSTYCYISQDSAPKIIEAANKASQSVDISINAIDCSTPDNVLKEACKDMTEEGFVTPMIVLYEDGQLKRRCGGSRTTEFYTEFLSTGKGNGKIIEDHRGDKVDPFKDQEKFGIDVKHLNTDNFDSFTKGRDVLVTYYDYYDGHIDIWRRTVANISMYLGRNATLKKEAALLAFVECQENRDLCNHDAVTKAESYPRVVMHRGDGEVFEYPYDREATEVLSFMITPITLKEASDKAQYGTAPFYEEGPHDVLLLDGVLFREFLKGKAPEGKEAFIMFHAPWCPHCQKIKPLVAEVSIEAKKEKLVPVAAVDCVAEPDICDTLKIESYPRFIHVVLDEEKQMPKFLRYDAPRSREYMLKFLREPTFENSEKVDMEEPEAGEDIFKKHLQSKLGHKVYMMDTRADYDTFVKLNGRVLGFYHAPWCVHSQNVVEDVARASRMLEARDGAIMGINCELPEFGELCNELEIEGYPTFLLHRRSRKPLKFDKSPSSDNLLQFIKDPLKGAARAIDVWDGSEVEAITSIDDFNMFMYENSKVFVFAYANWCKFSKERFNDIRLLAKELPKDIKVAAFDCEQSGSEMKNFCTDTLFVNGYPSVLTFAHGQMYRYRAAVSTYTEWKHFALDMPTQKIPKWTTHHRVEDLKISTLTEQLADKGEVFVQYYSHHDKHSKRELANFEEAADLAPEVSFVTFNCETGHELCNVMDLEVYPTFVMMSKKEVDGEMQSKQAIFRGKITPENLAAFARNPEFKITGAETIMAPTWYPGGKKADADLATKLATPQEAKALIKANTHVVVFFYAPWCGHCTKAKPEIEEVAVELEGRAIIAAVDCNEEDNRAFCKEHDVTGFPHLEYFKNGDKVVRGKGNDGSFQGKAKLLSTFQW